MMFFIPNEIVCKDRYEKEANKLLEYSSVKKSPYVKSYWAERGS